MVAEDIIVGVIVVAAAIAYGMKIKQTLAQKGSGPGCATGCDGCGGVDSCNEPDLYQRPANPAGKPIRPSEIKTYGSDRNKSL